MVYIHTRRYKETSHHPIEKIREQQHKHRKDIIQPRDSEGELNQDYIRQHGVRNLNISEHDIRKVSKTRDKKMERYLTERFKEQQKQNGNELDR